MIEINALKFHRNLVTSLETVRKFMINNQNICVNQKIQQKDTNECTYNYFILIHDDNPSPKKKQHYTSMISQRIFPSHFCGARPEASRRSLPSAARRALNSSASGEIHRVLRKFLCNIRSQKNGLRTLQSTNIPI